MPAESAWYILELYKPLSYTMHHYDTCVTHKMFQVLSLFNFTTYEGRGCRMHLQQLQECLPVIDGSNEVYISPGNEEAELQAMQLISGLDLLNPSSECREAVIPFLCLYLFWLCDASGTMYQPSSDDCTTISTDTCAREWQAAVGVLGVGVLPQCESLPGTSISCNGRWIQC